MKPSVRSTTQVLNKMQEGVILLNKELEVLVWNSRLEYWSEVTSEEIVGKNILTYFPHLKAPKYFSRINSIFAGAPPSIFSSQIHKYFIPCVMPNGQKRIQHTVVTPLSFSEYDYPLALITIQDVTEDYYRVQRLKEKSASLAISEQQNRAITSHVVDGLVTIDGKGIIETFNPAAEQLFGYSSDEIIGRNVSLLMPTPYKSEHDGYLMNYLNTGDAKIIGVGREVIGKRKNGSVFHMELAINEMRIIDGQGDWHQSFIGSCRDITGRKKVELALLAAKSEAENANRYKSEFLSSMSHELRTPLNAILGFAQLLIMDPRALTSIQLENINKILSSGKHLLELINEILHLARIESGHMNMSIEPVSLGKLLNELMLLTSHLSANRGINMTYTESELSHLSVMADKTRLKQVILNLISNAVKYNKKEGMVQITLEEVSENRLRLSVTDTGHGIPEDQQAGLFEAFNRLGADNSEIEGTGIGLNISKKLTELMNGTIGFNSTVGKGSCFYIELPLCGSHQTEQKGVLEAQQASTSTTPRAKQFKILYIEDNPANLELVRQILMPQKNVEMFSAPDAKLGIDLANTHQPDLILMDINLPGIDGIEAFKILKNDPITSHIPAIAVSANAMSKDVQQAMEVGFLDYIAKPINIPRFLEQINKVINEN